MAHHRVLSVGQCGFDHGRISRHLKSAFGAEVRAVDSFDEALESVRAERFDLVLVNRLADLDGAPGVELIRSLKADPELAALPVMLVSDLPKAQAEAQALGALPGFGKSGLHDPETEARLRAVLTRG